jgi:hypothetical protein
MLTPYSMGPLFQEDALRGLLYVTSSHRGRRPSPVAPVGLDIIDRRALRARSAIRARALLLGDGRDLWSETCLVVHIMKIRFSVV